MHFAYPTRPDVDAVVDANLRIAPGEVVALAWRSGTSTLFNLLLMFYEPNSGRILVDGHDVRELDAS